MYGSLSWFQVFLIAVFIILLVFFGVGYIYIYYSCMYTSVVDLPGYCLSFL